MKSHIAQFSPLQDTFKPAIVIAAVAGIWGAASFAQDTTPTAANATDAAANVASPASIAASDTVTDGTGAKPGGSFRTGESARSGGTAKKSPFAYDTGDTAPTKRASRRLTDPEPEEEKLSGKNTNIGSEEPVTRIIAPSFYGRSSQVITPGQGQFSGPKYRYGVSLGLGYDDNTFQTVSRSVGPVAQKRNRSGFTYYNGHWDAMWLKPRTVFTVNLEAGGDVYWDRPGDSSDVNARLAMLYVNKIDPRTQFTANASFAYLAQPDYSNLYASTNEVGGDYFTGSVKFDLSHRWTPLFSTLSSASVNVLKYTQDNNTQLSNSYWSYIFGNEFRFQTSPRLTWIAEGRYGLEQYMDNSSLDNETAYVLGGLDWLVSRQLTATFRAGGSFRSFEIGGSSSSPYAEFALNYRMARHSTLSLNGRYGYEQSTRAGDENLSYRLGLVYSQAFTTRLSGNAGFNFIHTDFSNISGIGGATDVYDVNVGLQYRIDRHFTIGARYSYTLQDSSSGFQNFDRNRILFSAQYEY